MPDQSPSAHVRPSKPAATSDSGRTCSYGRAVSFHAALRPEEVAVSTSTSALSWASLDAWSNRLARAFADSGARTETLVGIGLPNGPDCVAAVVACWKLGATPLVMPSSLTVAERDAIIAVAEPVLLVGFSTGSAPTVASIEDPGAASQGLSSAPLPERVSKYCRATCSGGSTGTPKVIVDHTPARCDPCGSIYTVEPGSTTLIPGPLSHSGPFLNCFWTLLNGGHVILMERFDAESTLQLIDRHRPTYVGLVPTMMLRIWRLPAEVREAYDLASLRRVVSSGAPCPAWLMQAWIDWLGPEVMFEAYGASERVGGTLISGTEWLQHPGSVGKPTLGRQIRIVDAAGRPLPAGERGQVYMKSGTPAQAGFHYLGAQPDRDADGWITLGDMGYVDSEGYLYLTDRKADMIVSGGANIFPAEVEAAIEAHGAVLNCVVIGLPDEDLGQRLHAVIHASHPIPADELRLFLQERLSRHKIPRSYEFVDQPLRNDAGKVRRAQLRAERLQKNT